MKIKKTIVLERALAIATPVSDFIEFINESKISEGKEPVYIYLSSSTEQDALLISTEPITNEELNEFEKELGNK